MKFSLLASSFALLNVAAAIPQQYEAREEIVSRQDTSAAKTIRIMPFGASIVEITCWRAYLWQKLQTANIKNIDFVGSGSGPSSCSLNGATIDFDKNHEGHSGALATQYSANGNLTRWLADAAPVDIIMMHLGTNDVVTHVSNDDTIKAYDTLLAEMRASNANMKIIVSNLIPISPNNFGQEVSDGITSLNTAIKSWVDRNGLLFVDNNTGFNTTTMTSEGEHPNEAGSVFMSDHFFPVLKDQIAAV
ncbi:SGNH hydrolase [Massarina eburnea CBS 473.64]|uniref:SGNH hydrolase n=1 Tax=Massarina eburnea CBS 473.64 TaxID=1395130 RepID=A0A6A6SCQ9_9PLEO|nr:SGNH hydrolase [Massarina eburnea CBS 473.64]